MFSNLGNREKYPAFVIFPQCPSGKRWVEVDWGDPKPHQQPKEPSEPMALVIELLPSLMKSLPIDPSRVNLVGNSMAGFGTWDLAARQPEWFAAAVPICGGADDSTAPLIAKLPVWTFHGDQDSTVMVGRTRSMVEASGKRGETRNTVSSPASRTTHGLPHLRKWFCSLGCSRKSGPEIRQILRIS